MRMGGCIRGFILFMRKDEAGAPSMEKL